MPLAAAQARRGGGPAHRCGTMAAPPPITVTEKLQVRGCRGCWRWWWRGRASPQVAWGGVCRSACEHQGVMRACALARKPACCSWKACTTAPLAHAARPPLRARARTRPHARTHAHTPSPHPHPPTWPQLTALGVQQQNINFRAITAESEAYITVREQSEAGNTVLIIDVANPGAPVRRQISADSALMCLDKKVIALKATTPGTAGDNLQVFNLDTKAKLKAHQMPESLEYWKWISPSTLGLVTATSVYHWSIEVRVRAWWREVRARAEGARQVQQQALLHVHRTRAAVGMQRRLPIGGWLCVQRWALRGLPPAQAVLPVTWLSVRVVTLSAWLRACAVSERIVGVWHPAGRHCTVPMLAV